MNTITVCAGAAVIAGVVAGGVALKLTPEDRAILADAGVPGYSSPQHSGPRARSRRAGTGKPYIRQGGPACWEMLLWPGDDGYLGDMLPAQPFYAQSPIGYAPLSLASYATPVGNDWRGMGLGVPYGGFFNGNRDGNSINSDSELPRVTSVVDGNTAHNVVDLVSQNPNAPVAVSEPSSLQMLATFIAAWALLFGAMKFYRKHQL